MATTTGYVWFYRYAAAIRQILDHLLINIPHATEPSLPEASRHAEQSLSPIVLKPLRSGAQTLNPEILRHIEAHFRRTRRLQLQGELQAKSAQAKQYKGVVHGVKVILQNEGPRGLFRGIGTAVCSELSKKESCAGTDGKSICYSTFTRFC